MQMASKGKSKGFMVVVMIVKIRSEFLHADIFKFHLSYPTAV